MVPAKNFIPEADHFQLIETVDHFDSLPGLELRSGRNMVRLAI
jgi:hypothetical protein